MIIALPLIVEAGGEVLDLKNEESITLFIT